MNDRTVSALFVVLVVAETCLSVSLREEKTSARELKSALHEEGAVENIRSHLAHTRREKLNARNNFRKRLTHAEQVPRFLSEHFQHLRRAEILPETEAREEFPVRRSEVEVSLPQLKKKEEMEAIPDQYWKGRFKFLDEAEQREHEKKN